MTPGFPASLSEHKDTGDLLSAYVHETIQDSSYYKMLLNVNPVNLPVIPPSSGVQFFRDGIVFLSGSKNDEKMLPQFVSFGTNEAYYTVLSDQSTGSKLIFSPSSSFTYPCEAITFSSDNTVMYFTKYMKKDKKEKIYKAIFNPYNNNNPEWTFEKTPLSFCKQNSTYSHPALSADGELLIFASDCKGTMGGMDLFISRKEGENWSEPVNAGDVINTAGNEFYPFLDQDNNLFFSSDSLPGYGGFDIFTCKYNGENWDKPLNLSSHINSRNDDIAFTIDKIDGRTAFYTQRNKTDEEEMQLYRVDLNRKPGSDLSTISYVFNGKPVIKPILITEIKEESPLFLKQSQSGQNQRSRHLLR